MVKAVRTWDICEHRRKLGLKIKKLKMKIAARTRFEVLQKKMTTLKRKIENAELLEKVSAMDIVS